MVNVSKRKRVEQVVRGVRESSLGVVLFHQAVGEILDINVTDMKCLDIITLTGSTSPSQLSELTGLSTGSTTAMIDRLERRGLVERQPNPEDRRGTKIVLSKEAARKLHTLFRSMAHAMNKLVCSYSEEELETLSNFFTKVISLWKEERENLSALE
ncbi:MAG TPA: MarR family transcriptional regulator [Candidatus Acidoferrales bacterium]|nr:MarR family transcriptional regulator [Candidatus Acidoferrales bacterium]